MTRSKRDRVFLDANVLFSAAYRADSGLKRLWNRRGPTLVTSGYAAEEARRNLDDGERLSRLKELLEAVEIVAESPARGGSEDWDLPAKDRPILEAAIQAGATHLLTGDVRHFGHLLDTEVGGVPILRPAVYLGR